MQHTDYNVIYLINPWFKCTYLNHIIVERQRRQIEGIDADEARLYYVCNCPFEVDVQLEEMVFSMYSLTLMQKPLSDQDDMTDNTVATIVKQESLQLITHQDEPAWNSLEESYSIEYIH